MWPVWWVWQPYEPHEPDAARLSHTHQRHSVFLIVDLTGDIEKTDAFPFESGGVADISRGYVKNSKKIRERIVRLLLLPVCGAQATPVAIKIFRRIHIDGNIGGTIKDLYDESKAWAKLDHPNVLPFLGFALDLGPSPALITPFHRSGTVMKHVREAPKTPQDVSILSVRGIADGLAYLHSQGLVHGNLTTKKVLVSDTGLPVICGYGLANISGQLSSAPSARFTAPEYYSNESTQEHAIHDTPAGDVYSLSMVIFEITSGLRPYHHLHTEHSVILHILPGGRPSRINLDPVLVSDRLWGFLMRLWSHQPAIRPDMNRVVLGLQSLQSDPDDKAGGAENEIEPSISYSTTGDFDIEEVSFGVLVFS
ncbi:kinase-like domain-containing protein [Mycena galopus ATCC 62051]|nr:kinase-like domain-containing protein [Mycena galopus ATCC 62051]